MLSPHDTYIYMGFFQNQLWCEYESLPSDVPLTKWINFNPSMDK